MRKVLALTAACTVAVALQTPAPAATGKRPASSPNIAKIETVRGAGGRLQVKVTVQRVRDRGRATPNRMQVRVGNKTCIVKSGTGSCAVRGLRRGSSVTVSATQSNRYGRGPWSTSYRYIVGKRAKEFFRPYRGATSALDKGSVLTQHATSLNNMMALPVASPTSATAAYSLASAASTIDFTGAVAIVEQGGSGLYSVSAAGEVSSTLGDLGFPVHDSYVAPDGRVFLAMSPTPLAPGGPQCSIAYVPAGGGTPTCVDPQMVSVATRSDHSDRFLESYQGARHDPVQFDDAGNVYVRGQSAGGTPVVRKYADGVATDLPADVVANLEDFVVLPTGDVILSGRALNPTNSLDPRVSLNHWVRRYSPTGTMSVLLTYFQTSFMEKFSDGRLWVGGMWTTGIGTGNQEGFHIVRTVDLATGQLDRTLQFGFETMERFGFTTQTDIASSPISPCFYAWDASRAFCRYAGTHLTQSFTFPELGQTWVLATDFEFQFAAGRSLLVRYVPSLLAAFTPLDRVNHAVQTPDSLVLAGTTAVGTNTMVIYNVATGAQQIVLDGTQEIRVNDMAYLSQSHEVMFSGVRISDGVTVLGRVAL